MIRQVSSGPLSEYRVAITKVGDRSRIPVLLAFMALLPIVPFFLFGYHGQDYLFHLHSWFDLRSAWLAHVYNPGWASGANYTLGDPRYLYYPPVSFLLGAGLSLVVPPSLTPAAFVWLACWLAGLSMYLASRSFVKQEDRVKAALLYMLSPYLLTTVLARFAASELLVQSWLPLLLVAFYEVITFRDRRSLTILSCLLGLSWLTNVPESIAIFYILLFASFAATFRQRSFRPLLRFLYAAVSAGALAAFYLLPVLREQRLINATTLYRFDYQKWLILARTHQHYESLQISCWLFACFSFFSIILCAWKARLLPDGRAMDSFLDLAVISFLFQLPLSVPLWKLLPKLHLVLFPFRFLPALGAIVPLMLLTKRSGSLPRIPIYVLFVFLSIRPFANYWGVVSHSESGKVHLSPLAGSGLNPKEGWEGIDEYIPMGATKPISSLSVPKIVAIDKDVADHCMPATQSMLPEHVSFSTNSSRGCVVQLPLFAYPYWAAHDGHDRQLPIITGDGGLAVVIVPPGAQTVELTFNFTSFIRTLGKLVSAVWAIILLVMFIWSKREANSEVVQTV